MTDGTEENKAGVEVGSHRMAGASCNLKHIDGKEAFIKKVIFERRAEEGERVYYADPGEGRDRMFQEEVTARRHEHMNFYIE